MPCHVPSGEQKESGTTSDASSLDQESLLEAGAEVMTPAQEAALGLDSKEDECPICTEPYGPGDHCLALLNCRHGLCQRCLQELLLSVSSADLGRVRCPLCRQKTPMLEWAICQLQEELLQADGPQRMPPPEHLQPAQSSGPWAALERRYQLRFLEWPAGNPSCIPFLPCPPFLGSRLWALREQGPCARRMALLGLLGLELLGLLVIFVPLMLLGLLFVLLDQASR